MKKKLLKIFLLTFIPFLFVSSVYAQEGTEQVATEQEEFYTIEEVQEHDEEGDCWMVFEGGVYDLSEYVPDHDKFLDIREWCGTDMTQAFKDKAGQNEDHKQSTYAMLEEYSIGKLENESEGDYKLVDVGFVIPQLKEDEANPILESVNFSKEYNILIPFVLTTILYWGIYFLVKKKKFFGINIPKFNAFWNTVLLLTLLIPAMAFGIFMMIRTQKPELWDINFDFMYWHVELSLVMGFIAIYHFIQRIPQYFTQFKKPKKV